MLFLADENINRDIVAGLLLRIPALDMLRVQDVGLTSADDPTVLEWAANEGRVLLTHDRATIPRFAAQRIAMQRAMPGIVVVTASTPIGTTLDDLELLIRASDDRELVNQVRYIPLS